MAAGKTFGPYLRQLRKAKGLRIRQLEPLTGLSNSFLSQIETGARSASPDTIRKLSAALGVTHIGMMIKAGHVTEDEVLTYRRAAGIADLRPQNKEDL